MQEHTHDRILSGIAVLASDDPDWDDGPFPVRGVALPEDITTNGDNKEGVSTYWPPETVQEAAALFEGRKITDGSEHTAEKALENPQPSPETIVGEITDARYEPGVGVLYEGEVDDPEMAKLIDRDRVEVSPTLYRALADVDEEAKTATADSVKVVRDLSIVSEGAADGNSIEPAAAAAMSALSAEALSAAFGGADTHLGDDGHSGQSTDDGHATGVEALAELTTEQAGLVEEAITQFVAAQGDATVDDLQDWLWNMDDELDPNVRTALDSALEAFYDEWNASSQVVSETFATWLSEQTDGTLDINIETMGNNPDNDITDDQRELLEALGALSLTATEAVVALRERAQFEEPHVIEEAEHEALQEDLEEAKAVFAEALSERVGMDAEKIAEHFSFEALREEFEDDDGNLAPEALVQEPETGDPDEATEATEDVEALLDELDAADRDEAVETLQEAYEQYSRAGWESHAESAKSDLETLGVEVN